MTKKTETRGRPPKPAAERQSNVLRILLTEAERKSLDLKAGEKFLKTAAWARTVLLGEAQKKSK